MKITDLKILKAGNLIKSGEAFGVVVDERLVNKKNEKNVIKIQWIGGGCAMMDSNYPPCMNLELIKDWHILTSEEFLTRIKPD